MPAETASYDKHVETLLDLTDEVSGCRVMVLQVIADGVVDPAEHGRIETAFGGLTATTRRALVSAEQIAAAFRLLRSLLYAGPTAWVQKLARQSARDLAAMEQVTP